MAVGIYRLTSVSGICCFSLKYVLLFFYGCFLYDNNLIDLETRWKIFLFFVPFFKLVNWIIGNNKVSLLQVIYSIFTDVIQGYFLFNYAYINGYGYKLPLTVFVQNIFMMTFERIEFLLFPKGTNNIIMGAGLDNFGLMLAIVLLLYLVSTFETNVPNVTNYFFFNQLLYELIADFSFGSFHYMEHKVKSLWERHRVHHEYKLENVSMWANFYADFYDALTQFGSFVMFPFFAFQYLEISMFPMYISETITGLSTHNKYVTNHVASYYFFESEIYDNTIGKLFGQQNIPEFHAAHHMHPNKYMGGWGYFTDELFGYILDPIISLLNLNPNSDDGISTSEKYN